MVDVESLFKLIDVICVIKLQYVLFFSVNLYNLPVYILYRFYISFLLQ